MARTRLARQAAVAEVPPAIEEPADELLDPEEDEPETQPINLTGVPLPNQAPDQPAAVRILPDGFPNPRAMTVWEYMQALSPAQWEQHMLYLYRKDPAPDKVAGEAAYLEKMAQPLDIDQVRQRWGGRKFHFYLNRMKSDGSGEYTVYRKTFAIDAAPKHSDPTKDAVLQMPANGGPDSGQAMKLLADLIRDILRQRDAAQQQGQKFDMSQAVTQAFSIMGNGANQAINIMAEQMKTALATAPGKPAPSELSQFKSFLEIFREMQPAASPLGQLKDLLEISRELRELEPAPGRGSFLETLAAQIAPQLGTLLDKVIQITSNIAAVRSPAGASPVRAIPGPAAIGAPGPQAQPAAPAQPPASGANGSTPAAPAQSQEQQLAEYQRAVIVEAIKRRIAAKAEAASRTTPEAMQDEGADAAQLANEMDAGFARLLEQTMRQNPMAIAYDPILGPCQRLPMIEKFIEGYLEFFAEEEPAPAAAGEARPN